MTCYTPKWHDECVSIEELTQQQHFPYTHFCLSSGLRKSYESSSIKKIVGIRDLRDVCVSIVYQIRKGIWPQFTGNFYAQQTFNHLSFDQQLLFVIEQEYETNTSAKLQFGIRKVAEQVVNFLRNPYVLVCRYEDLVGDRGGGDAQAQYKILEQIAKHIGLNFSKEGIYRVASMLYGNEANPFGQGDFIHYQSTYRNGKIGD